MNFVPTVDPSTFESTLLKNTYVHAALGAMMIGNPSFWVKSFSIAPPEEEPEDLEMGDWIPSQPEAVSLDLVRLFGYDDNDILPTNSPLSVIMEEKKNQR